MPPVTGYESDEEWEEKTNADYGKEWRQRLGLLGMCLGAVAVFLILIGRVADRNRAQARLIAGGGAVVGMSIGAGIGWVLGGVLDATINPRYARKRGKSSRKRPRARRGKKGYGDIR